MTNKLSSELVISQTKSWLKDVVIDLNLCPFAKFEVDRNAVRYHVDDKKDKKDMLEAVIDECRYLDNDENIETTLLIYPLQFSSFDSYLDFTDLANDLLAAQGYEGIYQIATFHPDYCFEGEPKEDPSNYTNRSPYPMLHFIREASLEETLNKFPNAESIPYRNIELTREVGADKMKSLLQACMVNK